MRCVATELAIVSVGRAALRLARYCSRFCKPVLLVPSSAARMGKLWRGARRSAKCKRVVPPKYEALGEILGRLHRGAVPRILIQTVYYSLLASAPSSAELVDSLEVFAGKKMYTKAAPTKQSLI